MTSSSAASLLVLLCLLLAVFSPVPASAQLGSQTSPIPILNGVPAYSTIDNFAHAPSSLYFNFTVSPSDLALQGTGVNYDAQFTVEVFGGTNTVYIWLLVQDPAGVMHVLENNGIAYATVSLLGNGTAFPAITATILAGTYIVQVVGDATTSTADGSKQFALYCQVQQRAVVVANVPTPLVLPTGLGSTLQPGYFVHADYISSIPTTPFWLILTTATNIPGAVSPFIYWNQVSNNADASILQWFAGSGISTYQSAAVAPYQFKYFSGDATCTAPPCRVHFMVTTLTPAISPTLQVIPTSSADPVTTLTAGTTTVTFTSALQVSLFAFSITDPNVNVTISITSNSGLGNADLYVAPALTATSPYVDQTSAVWTATSNGSTDAINFSLNSPYFLTTLTTVTGLIPRQLTLEGNYYLTVFGLIPDTYTLTLTLADNTDLSGVALPPLTAMGDLITGSVSATPQYYRVAIPSGISLTTTDVIFSLTTTCSDLYLSDVVANPGPTSSPFQVYSSTQPGSDLITITGFGDELHAGTYFIGVALTLGAVSPCPFNLSVSFDARQQVVEGVPMPQAAIAPGVIRYFDFYAPYLAIINWRAIVDVGVQPTPVPVSIFGTANNPSVVNNTRPAYAYPVPGMPSTYKYATSSNGSSPLTVLTSQVTGTILIIVNTCTGSAGCYFTVAVFAPFGGPGIPPFTFEMSAFSTSASRTLTNGTAVNGTLAGDSYQDYSYALTTATPTANCQLNVTYFNTPGSTGIYLCVVRNTGETFIPDTTFPDCDWNNVFYYPSSYVLSFNASTPQLTGSPSPTLNNVGGANVQVGTYLFLLIGLGGTNVINASYSILFTCYPYTNTAKPANLPLTPSVPVSEVIDPAATAYFVVDLTPYNINATSDVSVFITSAEARSPTGSSPIPVLSFSQNNTLPASTAGSNDYTITPSSSSVVQVLLTQASYSSTVTLSSAPLYISVYAYNPTSRFVTIVYGPLGFTILVTVTQRRNLTLSVPVIAAPTSTAPFNWYNVFVPNTAGYASLIVSLATALNSGAQLAVYSSPTLDPLADASADYTRAVNNGLYRAGGYLVFNNESCVLVGAFCRFSILVYTPTPTPYILLASNAASSAPPATLTTLSLGSPVVGAVGTAGTQFYQFYVPNTAGTVNITLTTIQGIADIFLAAGSATTPTFVDMGLTSYSLNPAVFFTNGTSAVKTISFTSAQWSALATTYNVIAPNLQGWYDLAVFGQTLASYSLSVQVVPPSALSAPTLIPLQNGVQVANTVSSTGMSYFSFYTDGSLGANVDVTFLVQSDATRAIPAQQTLLTMQISTTFPFTSSYWKATAAYPFEPFAFTANSQATSTPTISSCTNCFNAGLNQTYYIAVSPSTSGRGGGPFLITATYARRVAMPSSASTVSGSLLAGAVQTYTYVPTIVSPANLYASVAVAGAPGQAVLFYSGPATTGVTPFAATTQSAFSSVQQQTLHVATSCSISPVTNCVYYFQVLALTNIAYTFTLIDQVVVTPIVPGVPTTITSLAGGSGCSLVNFVVPLAHVNATISFSALPSPGNNVSVFVSSSVVSTSIVYPDALQNYWFNNAINLAPLTITSTDRALRASSTYTGAKGTSGTWTAAVCSQTGGSVTLTAGVQDINVPQPTVVPFANPTISGVAAAGTSSYAAFFVGVFTGPSPSLNFTLTSTSLSSLVLYVSPSFYPGPTPLVSFANFTLSTYETSSVVGGVQLVVGSGRVKLTPDTTYYVAVYNTATTPVPFTLTAAYSGLASSLVTPSTASLCVVFYSLPGNVDYPWSSASLLSILYDPTSITTSSGTAVTVLSGNGTRTFTNKFGISFVTPLTIAPPASAPAANNNLLYLNSQSPVDGAGVSVALGAPTQLPGNGPEQLASLINWYNQSGSGIVLEGTSLRVDGLGSSFLSSVPGFFNVTIGPANVNALSMDYDNCRAPISFTNGLRIPTQPSASNGRQVFNYSYSVSDGATYVVAGNLTFFCTSGFAATSDQLGNPYQVVVNVTGTRLYTHIPSGGQVFSTVSGLSETAFAFASQRFYPYALLSASPGVYTMTTAPFLDHEGVEFNIYPSAPVNGLAPGVGTQYNATNVYFTTPEPTAVLTEGFYVNQPIPELQVQRYFF